jgi:YHS domain-containing protein
MRLLIFLLLGYLLYRGLKKWLLTNIPTDRTEKNDHPLTDMDDVLVKDPFCRSYFPKRKGVSLEFEGEQLYFCSTECRDHFLLEQKKRKTKEKF